MFGLFKKKNHIKDLPALVIAQFDVIRKLAALMPLLADLVLEKAQLKESDNILEAICGQWICEDIGICVKIRKEKSGYYASLMDIAGQEHDFNVSYAIRTYKGMSYFVVDSYAIFIEYDKQNHEIIFGGNLSLVRKTADFSLSPDIPLDVHPN